MRLPALDRPGDAYAIAARPIPAGPPMLLNAWFRHDRRSPVHHELDRGSTPPSSPSYVLAMRADQTASAKLCGLPHVNGIARICGLRHRTSRFDS